MERRLPTRAEVLAYLHERRNWGRWGQDDQVGTLNLITQEKRVKAAALVRTGRSVSLSRDFPKQPGGGNTYPAQHWMKTVPRGTGGFSADYYGIFYHGVAVAPRFIGRSKHRGGASFDCARVGRVDILHVKKIHRGSRRKFSGSVGQFQHRVTDSQLRVHYLIVAAGTRDAEKFLGVEGVLQELDQVRRTGRK